MPRYPQPIAVEFDRRGKRHTRQFADAYAARRFYCTKLKQGRRPKVLKGAAQ